jgi:hypothetical protein
MYLRRGFWLSAALVLGLMPLTAATITYNISGTLGPVLAGSDPLGADGESGNITAAVSSTLPPTTKTKTSATYSLPAGAVTVTVNGTAYKSGKSTLKYSFRPAGPDTMVFTATVTIDGIKATIVGTVSLAKGSFTAAVTRHPEKFTPTPQTLTAATTASGAGSKVKYTVFGSSTTLGLTGTASN